MTDSTTERETEIFAGKLYEWLAGFGVNRAAERARIVAASFIGDGWTRLPPGGGATDV